MEVEEFVKTTLRQIISAVNAIDNEGIATHDVILDRSGGVEFDIAVSAETNKQTGGSAGLKVHVLQADGSKKSELKESSVSRIKFRVHP